MACLATSYEEMKAYLKNKRAIYFFTPKNTVADTIEALDHTTNSFGLSTVPVSPKDKGDDKRRYTLKNGVGGFFVDTFLSWRVTDKVNKLFKRGKTEEEIEAYREDPNNIAKAAFGTKGHEVAQMIGEKYYQHKMTGAAYDEAAILSYAKSGEYTFNKSQFDNLQQGVKTIIDEIFAFQRRIDPKGTVHIRFEQLLIDPVKDVGGTMDVIAIFSDKTATVYDYKFLTAGYDHTQGYGESKELITDSFIYQSKKEAWKLQLSTYKEILLNRYGLKDVRATKVVPVWIDYKDEPSKKKVNKVLIGKSQSEYLKYIHATYSKTNISEIDELLKSRYKELERLKKGPKDDAKMLKIHRIEDSIYALIEENNIEYIINDALSIATEYYDKTDLTYEELNDVINYLKTVSSFQQLFEERADVISSQDPELYHAIITVMKKKYDSGITVYDKLRNIRSISGILNEKLINKLVTDEGGIEVRDEQNRIVLKDDDFFTKTFLSTSESSNEVFQMAQRNFEKSYQNMREDLAKFYDKLNEVDLEVTKWLKNTGKGGLHTYLMNQYGNLHSRFNEKFFKDRASALSKKSSTWFINHYEIKDKNRLGETYAEWMVRAKKEYLELLERRYKYLKEEDEMKYNAAISKSLKEWIDTNDLTLNDDGTAAHPTAWLRSRWLTPTKATITAYKSKEFAFIESNEPLLNYYNALLDFNAEFKDILGYDSISANFLPKIRADFIEKLNEGNINAVKEDLSQIFNIRQDDTSFGMYDPTTGEIDKRVPVFFTNPFLKEDGTVDLNQQSKDITRSYLLFAKMAYNNKYMTEIEAKIQALKGVLSAAKYEMVNEKGQKVFDFMHNIATSNNTPGDTPNEKIFNALVDYHLYGIRVQPFQGKPTFTNTTLKLKNYVSMKMLGLGVMGATAGYVAAKSQAWIEGRKGVIYNTAQWNNATKLQAMEFNKYHAFAYFFGVHNDGMLQDIAKGTGSIHQMLGDRTIKEGVRKYINQRTLMRPFSYLDERIDNHIAVAMAQNYGVDESGNVRRMVNLPEGSKSIWELFNYNKEAVSLKVDPEGLKKILIQFRNIVRAGQKGIKGTMNDEDINYAQTNLILNLVSQFKTWMPGVINERFGKLKYNQILDAPQWGRYKALWNEVEFREGANTAIYVLGTTAKLLTYAAKDLITFGGIRRTVFGSKINLNEEAAKIYFMNFQQLNPDSKLTFEEFLEIKRAGIRSSLVELQVFLTLSAMIVAMRGDWDDDGDAMWKDNWIAHKLFQILNKASSEIAFTFNPLDYAKLIQNPLPIASLFVDAAKLLQNTADTTRDVIIGQNNKNDTTGGFYYTVGMIPGGLQLRKFLDITDVDINRER